jgi:RNA polymerase sigma-70 factor (ECF subfamily)
MGSMAAERIPRDDDEQRFARLYAEHGRDVMAYALRRASGSEDAADVVAETFLVAWRRLEDVPAGAEARLWLFGVARRALANQQRGERRRLRLAERLRRELRVAAPAQPAAGDERAAVLCALGRLDAGDRELMLLAGWEELDPGQIARVLGISAGAARTRLHRARRRLRRQLAAEESRSIARSTSGWELEEAS